MTTWKCAVLDALHRYSERHSTNIITRQSLIAEEIEAIVRETGSVGSTPSQTLSRVLQELRDEKVLYFLGEGRYLFLDKAIHVELEDLPVDAIDFAIKRNRLLIGQVPAWDQYALARRRKGQSRIRKLTLDNYRSQCAVCDVREPRLLVVSHIARWADEPGARGDLTNTLCLCRFHDVLFELGYFSLLDDYRIIKREPDSKTVAAVLNTIDKFRSPKAYSPSPKYLRMHRVRVGFRE